MLFIKDMKNLKIYKRQFFLPTRETESAADKKAGSVIFLLTPNRTSSISLIIIFLTCRMQLGQYNLIQDLSHLM